MPSPKTIPDLHGLGVLSGMNADKQLALRKLGIFTLGELVRYDPFYYARLVLMIFRGELEKEAVPLRLFLSYSYERKSIDELVQAPPEAIAGIGPAYSRLFKRAFGIETVQQLADFPLLVAAESYLEEVESAR